jgi:ABC-type sugar transport system substrate-binding protein
MWNKFAFGLMTVLAITSLVTGCSRSQAGPPAPTSATRAPHIAVIPPAMTSPFHVALRDGAVEQAKILGWPIEVHAPERETDFAGQEMIVEQLIQKGVDIISINLIDANAMISGVRKANEAKIPILMHNMITPISEGNVVEYIGYDQWGGGEKMGDYACNLLAKKYGGMAKGKVFILDGIPGFHTNRRAGGFKHALSKNCPNVKIVGEQTAEWEREKGANVATAALQKDPDIDLFFGCSDEMDIGAALAAEKLGKKVFTIGIDGNDVTLELIKQGKVTATLGVYPKKMGAQVVKQMQQVLEGKQVPYILLTPSIVVDQSNLEDYEAGKTWTEPIEGKPELDNGKPTVE